MSSLYMKRFPHIHFCPDCSLRSRWRFCEYRLSCLLHSFGKYPCIKHIMNHVIFAGSTPDVAKELYEQGL